MPLAIALARTEALVAGALKAADGGDIERARALLEEAGKPIDAWREANGIRLFSDCIAEISAAYEPLDSHRLNAPDLADAAIGAAHRRRHQWRRRRARPLRARGRREACARSRNSAGCSTACARACGRCPSAVTARDGALLYRLLSEQRSFEQLLSFRFG